MSPLLRAFFVLCLLTAPGVGRAEGVPYSFPQNPEQVALRADWAAFGDAANALKQGRYGEVQHKAVSKALGGLEARLTASRSLTEEEVQAAAVAAGSARRHEAAFWAKLTPQQKAGEQPLTPQAAAPVLAPLESLTRSLGKLFVVPGKAQGAQDSAPRRAEERQAEAVQGNVNRSVSSVEAAGGRSADEGASFWDRNTSKGNVDGSVNASAAAGPVSRPKAPPVVTAPSAGPNGLKISSVPEIRPQPSRRVAALPAAPALPMRDAVGAGAGAAVRAAVNSGVPVKVLAAGGAAGKAPNAPPGLKVGLSAEEVRQLQPPQPSPCEQVLKAYPSVLSMCKTSPNAALLLGGMLEAFLERFGSLQAILLNLAFLLLGLVLSALSGFGLIAKIVVSLVSLGFLAYTIGPLLKQGFDACKDWMGAKAGTLQNADALLRIGKVGGTVLILAIMAAIGWGVGKTKVGARAAASMQGAVTSTLGKLGVASKVAALDAKMPAGMRATLQKVFGGGKPAAETAEAATAQTAAAGKAGAPATAAPEPTRMARAESAVGRALDAKQRQAVQAAHEVGKGRLGKNGKLAEVSNYTQAQLREKASILKKAGFESKDIRALMERGIVGEEPVVAVPAASPADLRAQVLVKHEALFQQAVARSGFDPARLTPVERKALLNSYLKQKGLEGTAIAQGLRGEPLPAAAKPAAAQPAPKAAEPLAAPAPATPRAKAVQAYAERYRVAPDKVEAALVQLAKERQFNLRSLDKLDPAYQTKQLESLLYSEELSLNAAPKPKFRDFSQSAYESAKGSFEGHGSYYKVSDYARDGGTLARTGKRLYRHIREGELSQILKDNGIVPEAYKNGGSSIGSAMSEQGGPLGMLEMRVKDNPKAKSFIKEFTTHADRSGLGATVSAGDIKIEVIGRPGQKFYDTNPLANKVWNKNEAGLATLEPIAIEQIKVFGKGCPQGCFLNTPEGQAVARGLLAK